MSWITRITLFVVTAAILLSRAAEWKLSTPRPFEGRTIEVELWFADRGFNFPDLVEAAQIQIDHRLEAMNLAPETRIVVVDKLDVYTKRGKEEYKLWTDMSKEKYSIALKLSKDMGLLIDNNDKVAWLLYTPAAVDSNDLPYYVTQAAVDHLLSDELKAGS